MNQEVDTSERWYIWSSDHSDCGALLAWAMMMHWCVHMYQRLGMLYIFMKMFLVAATMYYIDALTKQYWACGVYERLGTCLCSWSCQDSYIEVFRYISVWEAEADEEHPDDYCGVITCTGRPLGFYQISTTKKKPNIDQIIWNIDHTALYRPNIDRKSSLKSAYLHYFGSLKTIFGSLKTILVP